MRVLIACHADLVPPAGVPASKNVDDELWRTEFYVAEGLKRAGHEPKFCGLDESLAPLKTDLKSFKPDVVFNLLEELNGEVALEPMLPAYLRSAGVPFTGCDPEGLFLTRNKLLTRSVLAAAGVRVPRLGIYPAIVKAVAEDSSLGISDRSVVKNRAGELLAKARLRARGVSRVFTEEYIAGREINVAVIWRKGEAKKKKGPDNFPVRKVPGNFPARNSDMPRSVHAVTFPPRQLYFGSKPGPKLATERVKWDRSFRRRHRITLRAAKGLAPELVEELNVTALRACEALSVNGLARVDFRVTDDGVPYVLEVNANPDVSRNEEVATAAKEYGLSYPDFLNELLRFAVVRAMSTRPRASE